MSFLFGSGGEPGQHSLLDSSDPGDAIYGLDAMGGDRHLLAPYLDALPQSHAPLPDSGFGILAGEGLDALHNFPLMGGAAGEDDPFASSSPEDSPMTLLGSALDDHSHPQHYPPLHAYPAIPGMPSIGGIPGMPMESDDDDDDHPLALGTTNLMQQQQQQQRQQQSSSPALAELQRSDAKQRGKQHQHDQQQHQQHQQQQPSRAQQQRPQQQRPQHRATAKEGGQDNSNPAATAQSTRSTGAGAGAGGGNSSDTPTPAHVAAKALAAHIGIEPASAIPRFSMDWLAKSDIAAILVAHHDHPEWFQSANIDRPPSGSVLLFDRNMCNFRKDSYNWERRRDGKAVREDHSKLKVNGIKSIYGCYAHLQERPDFHRRCYWLLDEPRFVLVHYLDAADIDPTAPRVMLKPDAMPGARSAAAAPSSSSSSSSSAPAATGSASSATATTAAASSTTTAATAARAVRQSSSSSSADAGRRVRKSSASLLSSSAPSRSAQGAHPPHTSQSVRYEPYPKPRASSSSSSSAASAAVTPMQTSPPSLLSARATVPASTAVVAPPPMAAGTAASMEVLGSVPPPLPPQAFGAHLLPIVDFAPETGSAAGNTKILVVGAWTVPGGQYMVAFGPARVAATLVQPGVLVCRTPPAASGAAGPVAIQVLHNGRAVSEPAYFHYTAAEVGGGAAAMAGSTAAAAAVTAAPSASAMEDDHHERMAPRLARSHSLGSGGQAGGMAAAAAARTAASRTPTGSTRHDLSSITWDDFLSDKGKLRFSNLRISDETAKKDDELAEQPGSRHRRLEYSAARTIQLAFRRFMAEGEKRKQNSAASVIQTAYRRWREHVSDKSEEERDKSEEELAAVRIQARFRTYREQKQFRQSRDAAIFIQRRFRARAGRSTVASRTIQAQRRRTRSETSFTPSEDQARAARKILNFLRRHHGASMRKEGATGAAAAAAVEDIGAGAAAAAAAASAPAVPSPLRSTTGGGGK